jgi:site-specific DNA-methyltransferase (adenine-specific)
MLIETDQAAEWEGWGTALKPALEPIVFARKPMSEPTVARNVLKWGTGAININACRIEAVDGVPVFKKPGDASKNVFGDGLNGSNRTGEMSTVGRFPANLLHDGSAEVLAAFPHRKSGYTDGSKNGAKQNVYGQFDAGKYAPSYGDEGSTARFFYSAKADKEDRAGSNHPTVKPVDLKRYLVRLVTPPGGTVLDAFAGTGTTVQAALAEGFHAVAIEAEPEYFYDMQARLGVIPPRHHDLFGPAQPWDTLK